MHYLSSETPYRSDENQKFKAEWFISKLLNETKYLGILNQGLRLKVGVPIMLLRKID